MIGAIIAGVVVLAWGLFMLIVQASKTEDEHQRAEKALTDAHYARQGWQHETRWRYEIQEKLRLHRLFAGAVAYSVGDGLKYEVTGHVTARAGEGDVFQSQWRDTLVAVRTGSRSTTTT